jgi:hypothetical protein
MTIPEKLEKLILDNLKKGIQLSSATTITTEKMQELLVLGADPLFVAGWLSGFSLQLLDEKYSKDVKYCEGYRDGSQTRKKLESSYLN